VILAIGIISCYFWYVIDTNTSYDIEGGAKHQLGATALLMLVKTIMGASGVTLPILSVILYFKPDFLD